MLSLSATFHIDSAAADIDGTKSLVGPTLGFGACAAGRPPQFFIPDAHYDAIITLIVGGTFEDEGRTAVGMASFGVVVTPGVDFSITSAVFFETYESDLLTPRPVGCPEDDDDDGDGLTDGRERLFSTLLGNRDSDLDGISDGNDDANRNGDDDEDEDDGDDCPDEDSDGDGEDDEDEDDDDDEDDEEDDD